MLKIKQFDTGDVLNYGMIGTIYKLLENGKESKDVVLKIEKIIPQSQSWWMENAFAFEMGSLYPQHFMQLHDYMLVSKCEHVQKYSMPLDKIQPQTRKEIEELSKSDFCIYRMYTRIDGALNKTDMNNYNISEIYSMLTQLLYIIELMQNHGWIHGDLHIKNIGYMNTKDTHIILGNVAIPTFGKRYYVIDYDRAKHKKFYKTEMNDLYAFTNWMFKSSDFWKNAKPIPANEALDKFKKVDIKINPLNNVILSGVLFLAKPEVFQKIVSPTTKEFYPVETYIPKEDILFFAENWSNANKLKQYFAGKLN